MSTDPNCIFCKIVVGREPCILLLEDAETLAFMNINPVHDGHALVIPKVHYSTIFDISPTALTETARTTAKVAKAINAAVTCDGLNLIQANGEGGAQSVNHFHFHVLPRRFGDGVMINWPLKPGDIDHIAVVAERIRSFL